LVLRFILWTIAQPLNVRDSHSSSNHDGANCGTRDYFSVSGSTGGGNRGGQCGSSGGCGGESSKLPTADFCGELAAPFIVDWASGSGDHFPS
jgi:hypothetical protein